MFINGQFVESKATEWIDVHNPVSFIFVGFSECVQFYFLANFKKNLLYATECDE